MATTKTSIEKTQSIALSHAEKIEMEINNKVKQIAHFQNKLENILNNYGDADDDDNVEKILKHRENLGALSNDLSILRVEYKRHCGPKTADAMLTHNQTILSTSSVRRKDPSALKSTAPVSIIN